jgi:UDP-N-acetylmuramate--alanine ligase
MRLRGFTNAMLADSMAALQAMMPNVVMDDDVLLTMGAGDIGQLSKQWQIGEAA